MFKTIRVKIVLLIFLLCSISNAVVVTTYAQLSTALSTAGVTPIDLGANITFAGYPSVNHTVVINGNGYALNTGPYYIQTSTGGGTVTFNGVNASTGLYLLYDNDAAVWDVNVTGTSTMTSTSGALFRDNSDHKGKFTVAPGSNLTINTSGASAYGLIGGYDTTTFDNSTTTITATAAGERAITFDAVAANNTDTVAVINGGSVTIKGVDYGIITADLAPNSGNVEPSNTNINVTGSTSLLSIEASITAVYSTDITGSDINITVTNGTATFKSTGFSPTIRVGRRPVIINDGGTLTATGTNQAAIYADAYGFTLQTKNSGTTTIETTGTALYALYLSEGDATGININTLYDDLIETTSGGVLNIKSNGTYGALYAVDTSGFKFNATGTGTKVTLTNTAASGRALNIDKYGSTFNITDNAYVEFKTTGNSSTALYSSDATNPVTFNVKSGGDFVINNTGSTPTGIYANDTSKLTFNVDGTGSTFTVNTLNNTSGTGYGISLAKGTAGVDFNITNGGSMDVEASGAGTTYGIYNTGSGNTTISGGSEMKIINNSGGGTPYYTSGTGALLVTGSDSILTAKNTNSGNTDSAINTTASGFTTTLSNLAEMYATNTSAANATISSAGTVTFNAAGDYDIKNLSTTGEALNNGGSTVLSLVNTPITMWKQQYAPSYLGINLWDSWGAGTVNLAKTGNTTMPSSGYAYATTSVQMGIVGRIANFINNMAGQKQTVTGGTSTVVDSVTGTYNPGSTIVYKLTFKNNSTTNLAQGLIVKDLLSTITTLKANGTTTAAFTGWTITASNTLGSTGVTNGTTVGVYTDNSNLNTIIDVAPSDTVTYTITATVANGSVGSIVNNAIISGITAPGTVTYTSKPPVVTSSKLDSNGNSTGTYSPSVCTSTGCTAGTLTYKITVSNGTGAGFADNISVSDAISSITSQLSNGTTSSPFASWTITAQLTDASNVTTSLASGVVAADMSTAGTFSNNSNLNTTVDIAPGAKIVYTVTATLKPLSYGNIVNNAVINGVTSTTTHSQAPSTVTVDKKDTNETSSGTYTASGTINYIITVSNTGTGIANDIPVNDIINSIQALDETGVQSQAFATWTITAKNYSGNQTLTSGGTTTYGTTPGTFSNNNNISTNIDIAPGDKVIYYVTGTVKSGIIGTINNTAQITNESSQVLSSSTAHTMLYVDTINDINVSKSANVTTYKAGDSVTYTITLTNLNTQKYAIVNIVDLVGNITVTNLSGTVANAFNTSGVSIATTSLSTANKDNIIVSGGTDAIIKPNSSVTYTISGLIANQVYGNIVNNAIATLNAGSKTATNTITPNINDNSGNVTGQKKVISVQ